MKRLLMFVIIGSVSMGLIFTSCKKSEKEELEYDTTSTEDAGNSESNFDQVFQQVDNAAVSKSLGKAGPIVTIDSSTSPIKMTLDYGVATICDDAKIRSGKIFVTWTGRYRDPQSVINITFENFKQENPILAKSFTIDNISSKTITNNGRNASGQLNWTISVNAKITIQTGQNITWISNRSRTWLAGEGTPSWNDDKYEVKGTTSGTNRNGKSYVCNIREGNPLLVDLNCNLRRITKGIIDLTPEGKPTRTIDFGDGTCDADVTVTVNGRIFKIGKY